MKLDRVLNVGICLKAGLAVMTMQLLLLSMTATAQWYGTGANQYYYFPQQQVYWVPGSASSPGHYYYATSGQYYSPPRQTGQAQSPPAPNRHHGHDEANHNLQAGYTCNGNCPGAYRASSQLAYIPPPEVSAHASATGYILPVSYTQIGSRFGPRINPIHRHWDKHEGTDFSAPEGTPVVATKAGRVYEVVNGCFSGRSQRARNCGGRYGNYIVMQHDDGTFSRYAHLSAQCGVRMGYSQSVRQGEPIGCVGSTGRTTGPNLHFEIHEGGYPNPIDVERRLSI